METFVKRETNWDGSGAYGTDFHTRCEEWHGFMYEPAQRHLMLGDWIKTADQARDAMCIACADAVVYAGIASTWERAFVLVDQWDNILNEQETIDALGACEADIERMYELARERHYDTATLNSAALWLKAVRNAFNSLVCFPRLPAREHAQKLSDAEKAGAQ